MTTRALNHLIQALLLAAALTLTGCWTPPKADVQPTGQPGLIQDGIRVTSVKAPARVAALDGGPQAIFGGIPTFIGKNSPGQPTITLSQSDGKMITYPVEPTIKKADRVKVGDLVKVTVEEELAVYVLVDGRLPDGTTAEALGINARMLTVDPSYRLLTVQYPGGRTETFKPGLGTRLLQMQPGDSVAVRPVAVTAIHVEKH
jgi:hypothetical protein